MIPINKPLSLARSIDRAHNHLLRESKMQKTLFVTAATVLAISASPIHAHEAGDIILRAGAAMVSPNDSSSRISAGGAAIAGSKATVNSNTQLGLTLGYMLTDNIGVELLAATPFSHRVSVGGVGAAIDGTLARVKHLPPTVTLQYFPLDKSSRWQPYVGAGLNYTTFFNEKLTSAQKANGFSSLSLSDSWGLALQVGSDWKINDRLMLNAAVWRIDIDTKATMRLGATPVKVKVDIDPWVYMVGLGYRF